MGLSSPLGVVLFWPSRLACLLVPPPRGVFSDDAFHETNIFLHLHARHNRRGGHGPGGVGRRELDRALEGRRVPRSDDGVERPARGVGVGDEPEPDGIELQQDADAGKKHECTPVVALVEAASNQQVVRAPTDGGSGAEDRVRVRESAREIGRRRRRSRGCRNGRRRRRGEEGPPGTPLQGACASKRKRCPRR